MKKKLASTLLAAALLVTTVPVATQAEVTYEEQDSGTNIGQKFHWFCYCHFWADTVFHSEDSKDKWTAAELNPDSYVEDTNNTIQM